MKMKSARGFASSALFIFIFIFIKKNPVLCYMKFGKLPSIAGVDFSLPDDAIFNATAFRKLPQTNAKSKVYVGCTGWS